MMILRSFLPVGQGAFYLEQFRIEDKKINIIIDCGSSTSIEILKKRITENLSSESLIHAVFISHFDEDHFNGLYYLLSNYTVKNLFLPLITENERKTILLSCLAGVSFRDAESFYHSFFSENPYNAFSEFHHRPHIYLVQDNHTEQIKSDFSNEIPWRIDAPVIHSGKNVSEIVFADEIIKADIEFKWEYVPFNFKQKTRYEELARALCAEFGYPVTLDSAFDLINDNQSNIKKIRNAYKTISGSMNTNSMVLFSGVRKSYFMQRVYKQSRKCVCRYCYKYCPKKEVVKSGCLYLGDYDLNGEKKWHELREALDLYWLNIGCIQIPHHGSRHNYNDNLTDDTSKLYIISAGQRNKYHHPHSYVIKDMLLKQIFPMIITEDKQSEVLMIIEEI